MKNKKLHIIFLDFDDIKNPLLGAGQAVVTAEVGKRFAKKGHKITVICSKYPGYKDRTENGIHYKHIGVSSENIKVSNALYILLLPFSVMRLRGDIVVECFTAPVTTLLSPLYTRIPVVALSTSFDADRFSKQYKLPFWLIEKYGCKIYKYFIALTPYLAKKMLDFNSKAIIRIIPQGISKEFFSIENKKPEYILFLGRLDINQKGLDLLLNAYSIISNKIKYPLVIAGDGPDKKKVNKLIDKLNLTNKVKLVGYADKKKKMDLLSKCAFVAFPSRNEGFSLVSLEAIASGHKLVVFDIPSMYWTDDKIARKVKPFVIEMYAEALLLESNSHKSTTTNLCRGYAEKYSWKNVSDQFENFFLEITDNRVI